MTDTGPEARAGDWLTRDAYKAWARIDASDTRDDAAIDAAVAAAAEAVELRAPVAFATDVNGAPIYDPPPPGVQQAGLLLANRLMSRRNSPDGVVGVPELGTARIASYDADISALLGPWTEMVIA